MSLLKLVWLRLDQLQRQLWFRSALTAVFAIVVLGYFGAVAVTGIELRNQRFAIMTALRDVNLLKNDEAAHDLADRGVVVLNGQTFGGPQLAPMFKELFDDGGRLTSPGTAAELLLEGRIPTWAPRFLLSRGDTVVILGLGVTGVLVLSVWTGLAMPLFAALLAGGAVAGVFLLAGSLAWAVALAVMTFLLFGFALLVRTAAIVLGRPTPIFAIASTVLRESMRLRLATVFVGGFLLTVPLLPLWISRDEPLRYRVQTFLGTSTGLMFLFAALMTVFLSCATVAFEIRDRQIWQLMTKPVGRTQYILGKWLGVVVLNVILLGLGGAAIFTYAQYYRTQPAKDIFDRIAVEDEIMVARAGAYPAYRRLEPAALRELVEKKIDADVMLKEDIAQGDKREIDVKRDLARQVALEFAAQQRSIPPGGDGREFVFVGLLPAKRLGSTLSIRYAFDIGAVDPHEVYTAIFLFPDGFQVKQDFVPAQTHVLQLTPDLIDDEGKLTVRIINGKPMRTADGQITIMPNIGPILFKPDALEVLYRVDTFEWNFARALAVQLVKLAFLGMLGVVAATVLSFPVACMLAFTVLAIGSIAPFLGMSLAEYSIKPDTPAVWQWFQYAVKAIATVAEWLLRAFGETSPTSQLVEGRLVSWADVGRTLGLIGLAWTGGTFALGLFAFGRKELATYSGHS